MGNDQDRLNGVFHCIVQAYIDTAVPVGSRTISRLYSENLSPASIRSVMADLEDLGLITHPHTSAGRIPTEKGYRHYVDAMVQWDEAKDWDEIDNVENRVRQITDIEMMGEALAREVSDLTENMAVFLVKNVRRIAYLESRLGTENRPMEATDSGPRVFVSGARYMLSQPEFSVVDRIRNFLSALETREPLVSVLGRSMAKDKLSILIGRETESEALTDVSVVSKVCRYRGEPIGCLAVMGPTRMKYDRTGFVVSHIADSITEFLDDTYDE